MASDLAPPHRAMPSQRTDHVSGPGVRAPARPVVAIALGRRAPSAHSTSPTWSRAPNHAVAHSAPAARLEVRVSDCPRPRDPRRRAGSAPRSRARFAREISRDLVPPPPPSPGSPHFHLIFVRHLAAW